MFTFTPFYLAVICVTSICLLTNSFLIYFASKLSFKGLDIKLIILLASLEYLAPIAVLSDLIYYSINGHKLIENQYGCSFYGFIILFIYQYEIMLSSLLSMERLAKIKKSSLFKYTYWPVVANLIIFTILLVTCAITNSFAISSSKISCLLDVTNSILASVTYHYSLLSCFIGVGLLVYSYYCIANEISELREIMSIESDSTIEVCSSNRFVGLKKATIKVYLILSIYGACMLSSLVCLFFESALKYEYGDSFEQARDLNSTATLLFVFGMIFNTLLVLTLHTGISNEVKHFIQKVNLMRSKYNLYLVFYH
ncbi:hypothetical protein K502DRAFT_346717 [Neoconidiobolus thromboides FSU 785]|nr:hypothetical protein K502DRAFT_346717 [Neoconidiobolus thromboides FSU 785]